MILSLFRRNAAICLSGLVPDGYVVGVLPDGWPPLPELEFWGMWMHGGLV